jgi:hypothetical protein
MYEVQRQEEPGGCRDALLLTRSAFAVLLPPMLGLAAVLILIGAAVVLFARHPALALIPIAALIFGVALFARWEQGRFRPPDL